MDRHPHSKGLIYSLILHGLLLALIVFGLPSLFHKPELHDSAISVELLPMSEISNVKKKVTKPKPEPQKPVEKSKPVAAQPADAPKPEAPKPDPTPEPKAEPKPEPKPEPKKPEPKPEPKKPELKKPEPVKQEPKAAPKKDKPKPKKKPKASELDSLLKTLEEPNDSKDVDEKKTKKSTPKEEPLEENDKSDSTNYNDAQPLSMNEQDAIRSQVEKHWSPPAGAKDAGKMQVVLRVKLLEDGTVSSVKVEKSSSGFGADGAIARAFDESSIRAVKMSSPLQHLSADKYDSWKEFTFTFTPEGAY